MIPPTRMQMPLGLKVSCSCLCKAVLRERKCGSEAKAVKAQNSVCSRKDMSGCQEKRK